MGRGWRRKKSLSSATPGKMQSRERQTLPFRTRHHLYYILYTVNRRWCLQVASSFWRKTRSLFDDAVLRKEQGTRRGREETVTGTSNEARTGTIKKTGTGTRTGMGAELGTGTRAKTERRVEGKESPGGNQRSDSLGGIGRKMRERGRRRRVSSSQPQHPTPQRDRCII